MSRAFIVLLDIDDGVDPDAVAYELLADLSDFDVISVHPWASPGTSLGSPALPVGTPPVPQANIQ